MHTCEPDDFDPKTPDTISFRELVGILQYREVEHEGCRCVRCRHERNLLIERMIPLARREHNREHPCPENSYRLDTKRRAPARAKEKCKYEYEPL